MKRSKFEFNANDAGANDHVEYDTPPAPVLSNSSSSEENSVYGPDYSADEEDVRYTPAPLTLAQRALSFFKSRSIEKNDQDHEFAQIHGMK